MSASQVTQKIMPLVIAPMIHWSGTVNKWRRAERWARRLALVPLLFLASCRAPGDVESKVHAMQTNRVTVWSVIEALGERMPLSKRKVEEALPVELELKTRTQYMAHWVGGGCDLEDGVRISKVHLVLDAKDEFDATSGLTLELSGRCLTLSDVRARHPDLVVTDAPRGRSFEELAIHTTVRQWGRLSFAFKEARRDCAFSISLAPPAP